MTLEELSPIDIFFAERLLARYGSSSEADKMVLARLMNGARQGHLCIQAEEKQWGIKEVHADKNRLYLQKNWLFETRFIEHIERLKTEMAPLPIIEENMNEEQRDAVKKALSSSLTLISGGPGTGKTYVASKIVKSFLAATDEQAAIGAFTGKAASRLEENMPSDPRIKCGTLHTLLKIYPGADLNRETPYLPAGLVIVDECSMIDAELFPYFMSALKKGTRLILMGDPDQLPPVEAGSLFADLVWAANEGAPIAHAALSRCMRTESEHILNLASAIRLGKVEEAIEKIGAHEVDLWERVRTHFPLPSDQKLSDQELFEEMGKFKILSCMRKGPLGVDALNEKIVERMRQEKKEWWAAPISITRNDHGLGLFNGDAGILVHRFNRPEYALFSDRRSIPASLLPPFEWGYCLSVHKSQGSEYRHVYLLVPPGSEAFGREVLYTGVTRAREIIEIDADAEILRLIIQRISRKISGLHDRLVKTGE